MKKLLVLACVIFLSSATYSQETVLVTKKRSPEKNKFGYSEEYSVLKSNKKIRHGSYVKVNNMSFGITLHTTGTYVNGKKDGYWQTYYTGNNNIKAKGYYKDDLPDSLWQYFYSEGEHKQLVEVPSAEGGSEFHIQNVNAVISKFGFYRNGRPFGIWEYFNTNEQTALKYDHTKNEVLFIQGRTLLTYPAGYKGTEFHLYEHLYDTLNLHRLMESIQNWSHQTPGKLVFTFTIDEQGAVTNVVCTTKDVTNKKIYARAMEVIESLNGQFYPRKLDGVNQPDHKTITFDLIIHKSEWGTLTENYSSSHLSMNFNIKVLLE